MTDSFRPTSLRDKARNALSGKWGASAVACLVFLLITGAIGSIPYVKSAEILFVGIRLVGALLVGSIVGMGALFLWLDVSDGKPVEIKTLFEAFSDYLRYLVGGLLVFIYTILWMLLFVVPGIIKSISYSMTFYLMRENPRLSGEEAIRLSMKMMHGHKMDYFLLQLSFIGWLLLCVLTLGIGLLWLYPYIYTANAGFYKELKKEYEIRQTPSAA